MRRFLERLADLHPPDHVRPPGQRLSDRLQETPTLEQDVQDALAVLDAAGSERAALFTYGLGRHRRRPARRRAPRRASAR